MPRRPVLCSECWATYFCCRISYKCNMPPSSPANNAWFWYCIDSTLQMSIMEYSNCEHAFKTNPKLINNAIEQAKYITDIKIFIILSSRRCRYNKIHSIIQRGIEGGVHTIEDPSIPYRLVLLFSNLESWLTLVECLSIQCCYLCMPVVIPVLY